MMVEYIEYDDEALRRLTHNVGEVIERTLGLAAFAVWGYVSEEAPVDEGILAGSFNRDRVARLLWRVYTRVFYAPFVHEGTGVFGPRRRPITPTSAQALRFETKQGDVVFARSVRGQRPNPFAERAVRRARGEVDRYLQQALVEHGY